MFEDQPEASVEYLMTVQSLKQTLLDSIHHTAPGEGVLPCIESAPADSEQQHQHTRAKLLQMAVAEERRVLAELRAKGQGA